MKKTILISALVVMGGFAMNATADGHMKSCSDVVWGAEILADNPNIADACLEVVDKRGTYAVKMTARIVRQSVNSTIVQWQMPDGSWSSAQRRYPARGATAELEGKEVRISDLVERQVVNVYLPAGGQWDFPPEPEAAAAPPPPPPPPAEPEPEPEALPTTATQVPAFALLGGLLLLLGGAVSFVRTRL